MSPMLNTVPLNGHTVVVRIDESNTQLDLGKRLKESLTLEDCHFGAATSEQYLVTVGRRRPVARQKYPTLSNLCSHFFHLPISASRPILVPHLYPDYSCFWKLILVMN